jgi:V-type H+-transporting ATPase subunit C
MATDQVTQQTDQKRAEKARKGMDSDFSYLAGNAFGRDSKGRIQKEESVGGPEIAGLEGGSEYSAYVCCTIDVS